jgi:hypothetical protein
MTYLRQSEVFEAGKWVPKSTSDVFKIALFLIENASFVETVTALLELSMIN